MSKIYIVIFTFLLVTFKAVSQDTIYPVPPSNLQAFLQDNIVQLSWQAPVDTTTSNDTIPPGLSGYRIYCNNVLIGNTAHPTLTFFDTNPDSAVSFYKVTALYDLAFYGFPGDTAESMPSNLAYAVTGFTYILPFNEEFTTGLFQTNEWITESNNWIIHGQMGNPAPCAGFQYVPIITNYSSSLISPWIDASGLIDGQLFIEFDLRKDVNIHSMTEHLFVDVFDGFQWSTVVYFTNDESADWVHQKRIIKDVMGQPFKIRFRAEGENSTNIVSWYIDNIEVKRECQAPINLVGSFPWPATQGCVVLLEWESPEGQNFIEDWLEWDAGYNSDAIGLTNGGTFFVSVRFTQAQLSQYYDTYLTKIKFFPVVAGGEITLKVWTGINAANIERSQVIDSYIPGEWNEVTLNNPFYISGNDQLWFGYQITHASGQYIAGVDDGPAVAGYGDLISLDGITWESMSQAYNLDNNWNLAGFVSDEEVIKKTKNSKSLVQYNIFRDNEFLATTSETEYYDDINLFYHLVCYNVTAVYNDCESDFSNTSCPYGCHVGGVDDNEVGNIDIYPNPASSLITVALTGDINQLIFTDMTGRKVKQLTITPGTTTIPIDVSEFAEGMYVVRFITKTGESGARKLLIDR